MILKLMLFIAVTSSVQRFSGLASPQYTYGIPSFAPAPASFQAASFPAAPPAASFQAAPPAAPFQAAPPAAPFPAAPPAIPGPSVQEDAGALELLPPLQHVVGTKYRAVSPGRGFKFPISQLLNPTPPPNLKH